MCALREMTRRFTAELAIRPFLTTLPRTFAQCTLVATIRITMCGRLVSEKGPARFLPWGGNLRALLDPPHPTLALLEKLHRDPSDYGPICRLPIISRHQQVPRGACG